VVRTSTIAATGAVLASPTTSLPEVPGADRQFDYRYCWLRDGSLAAAVAAVVGESSVADAYLGFLEDLGPEGILQSPLWTAQGTPVPDERTVSGVAGWAGSRPVRVGNAAKTQLQYDALGFVAEAIGIVVREGGALTPGRWALVESAAERAASGPPRPTAGIWELREPEWLIVADIGRWMALDHGIRLAAHRGAGAPHHWIQARDDSRLRVRAAIGLDGTLPQAHRRRGLHPRPDASCLLAVICGLLDPDDPTTVAVVDRCLGDLGRGPFLHRYPPDATDGFHGAEHPFLPACFWAVTALATIGRYDEAAARLDALDAALPRLLPEVWDDRERRGLGNAPLVWSHIEAIRAAYAVDGSVAGSARSLA
jgi:GH15 family glucan-1,4-alpha-glucosidase